MYIAHGSKVEWSDEKRRYVVTNKWQWRGPGRAVLTSNNVIDSLSDMGVVSTLDPPKRVEA